MWIWNYGDYEIYHTNLVNSRRQEYGADYPAFWRLSPIEINPKFYAVVNCDKDGYIVLHVNGKGYIHVDGRRHAEGEKIEICAGEHQLEISVTNMEGLPAAFIESDVCTTDSGWYTVDNDNNHIGVGCDEKYNSPDITPDTFIFAYERMLPVAVEAIDGGRLFDFGKEIFGHLVIKNANPDNEIYVGYGESREEACDRGETLIYETVKGESEYKLVQRAFRYIFISGDDNAQVEADYEYLPLEYKGSFRCDNEVINKIWDISAYTFHLNCREVILDGIKRDRWCWSGDAYQSYRFNNYLFFDEALMRRTIIGLRGSEPVVEHINTITDYSFYWIISLYDYYMTFGKIDLVEKMFSKAQTLMEYAEKRVNSDGFVTKVNKDWIFIDWTEMDKDGAVCAEQMLFIEAYRALASMAKLLNKPYENYQKRADELLVKVNKFYWNDEKGAFIDCYESGKNNVTRHANIFAIMYDLATKEQKGKIIENVLKNDNITKITTPYFEGFELDVMGKIGNVQYIENMLSSYWKGMLDLGATTIWEEYDPKIEGIKHYEMYGNKYGKSHCHAWGASPVYLLGRYYLGVYPTAPGYKSFEVAPNPGGFGEIEGTVPVNGGTVCVHLNKEKLTVKTDKNGGTLVWNNERYTLDADKELIINI